MARNKIIPYDPKLREYARHLRLNPTKAEALLWKHIRNRIISGFQFHRQVPMVNYIVDFYCHEIGLAIGLDGISHKMKFFYDSLRQTELQNLGVSFLRFKNQQVFGDTESVLEEIEKKVLELGG